jgi:hypothetical protein
MPSRKPGYFDFFLPDAFFDAFATRAARAAGRALREPLAGRDFRENFEGRAAVCVEVLDRTGLPVMVLSSSFLT